MEGGWFMEVARGDEETGGFSLRETQPELSVSHLHGPATIRAVFAPMLAEHEQLRSLLRCLVIAQSASARATIVQTLRDFLLGHDATERAVLYEALRVDARTRAAVREATEGHEALEAALGTLAVATLARTDEVESHLADFRQRLTVHLLGEEHRLYPLALRTLGVEECVRLVARFRDARSASHGRNLPWAE